MGHGSAAPQSSGCQSDALRVFTADLLALKLVPNNRLLLHTLVVSQRANLKPAGLKEESSDHECFSTDAGGHEELIA